MKALSVEAATAGQGQIVIDRPVRGEKDVRTLIAEEPFWESPWIHETAEVRHCRMGAWTSVGPRSCVIDSSFGDFSYVINDGRIFYARIGKFCSMAANVRINHGGHQPDSAAFQHLPDRSIHYDPWEADDGEFFKWRRSRQVVIGHDVWIGCGAVILPGRKIGTGAIIGAGAVVTEDVAPFAVVGGAPARVIKKRFQPDVEEALFAIRWWDWPREELMQVLPDVRCLSAEEFVHKYGFRVP